MTTRPNHPLPRQDLHLQACQRPKAAHRKSLFARPHVLGAARVTVRLQEMGGQPTPANLQFAGMSAPATLAFKPYELKTLRLERDGNCHEVNVVTEA